MINYRSRFHWLALLLGTACSLPAWSLDLTLQGLWLVGAWLLLPHSQHLHLGPRLLGPEVLKRLLRVGHELHQHVELPVW